MENNIEKPTPKTAKGSRGLKILYTAIVLFIGLIGYVVYTS